MATVLQYVPFSSMIDQGFWHKLSENKLNVYGLDDKARQIRGFYYNGDPGGLAPRLTIDYAAFDTTEKIPARNLPALGVLHNMNTVEAFKEIDKKQIINSLGTEIWNDIKSGAALKNPSLLSRFLLLTYANLKKYHYFYWFASPCLVAPETVNVNSPPVTLDKRFSPQQVASLLESYDAYQLQKPQFENYFILVEEGDTVTVRDVATITQALADKKKVLAGFCDPCTLETNPGWPLRNFITLLAFHCANELKDLEVVCFRDRSRQGQREVTHSLVISIKLSSVAELTETPKVLGWERNERQKMGARMVDLSASMDPTRLAESAVDLNLKLMRWRLMPDLCLEKIGATRCLLLGSGTLGCNVARNLLSWGVRHITFLDNARVSYSNPVRQSLFTFEDCLDGGKPKAQAAADALKRIFPGVISEGVALSIPMPGHSVSSGLEKQVEEDVKKLEQLIEQHDVIFLLMDTRESRWLPSVIAGAKGKIVINAALGFDTFLVLRHGVKTEEKSVAAAAAGDSLASMSDGIPGSLLGCYFCNDVVAPGNSMKDRTLDQQCTVTRPGVSLMAGALAVELLISVLQHPKGSDAPSETSSKEDNLTKEAECSLGLVPHQIRGFLSRFHQILPAGRAFDKCTACSHIVLEHYQKDGFQFLLRAFNEPMFLEDLTGLTQMHQETMEAEVWDLSDDEELSSMET
ncbi:ubiquitin-like modifier-activating enzyme ATG7 [Littorina saxatilis]|uniref:Ubiquitin-like modifier-activating enzyme ATG7 n=1 Tax=Littorina saxatilis TaxID=31220 RepID=A0AAN9BB45_9CAEN